MQAADLEHAATHAEPIPLPTALARRAIRTRAGVNQPTLAAAVRVGTNTISRWETVDKRPRNAAALERYVRCLKAMDDYAENVAHPSDRKAVV